MGRENLGFEEIEPTSELAACIKAIDSDSVHKICSGQVVFNLAMAVKEVVENAIDARSTSIDVRLKDSGSDLIRVSDNGYGIEEHNFKTLAMKSYTSKIQSFDDLNSLSTFGFRGEALSALCLLGDLTVITRHKSCSFGTKVNYDRKGAIQKTEKCARQTGTTVELRNLFKCLPVRFNEFQRNIKKEFTKLCNIMYAYGLISTGIKITCSNEMNNKLNYIMSTTGNNIRENIASIFGIKQVEDLLEIDDFEIDSEVFSEFNLDLVTKENVNITLYGFISSGRHGSGRNSSDRQFIYANKRPVDYPKIIKTINNVYHVFNSSQYPFVCLNFQVPPKDVDVNVTPAKRLVFFQNEKLILAILKSTLLKLFRKQQGILRINLSGSFLQKRKLDQDSNSTRKLKKPNRVADSINVSNNISEDADEHVGISESQAWKKFLTKSRRSLEPIPPLNLSEDSDDEPKFIIKDIIDKKSSVNDGPVKQETRIDTNMNIDQIKSIIQQKRSNQIEFKEHDTTFGSVSDRKNVSATLGESELSLTKESFTLMTIIGQFNKGFIITKLNDDLFIIDQHASDEIYNYETLRSNTNMTIQPLIMPQTLNLTPDKQQLLIDNIELFQKLGFAFKVISGGEISLTAIPISKNIEFGKDDIDEMLFLLEEASIVECEPSKMHRMFASRACRKSVMVGHSLQMSDMRKIVSHMSDISKPWNCPHGRPTIRHLVNLKLIDQKNGS